MSRLLAALALALAPLTASAGDFPLKDGRRVVFLGDSITHSGGYIRDIETFLFTRFPDREVEFINLGLSSETASGLTEPDHPFPRPDVRERLGRVLDQARPDLVVACYGMNDGIYHPPSPERTSAYRKGIGEVVARVKASGAEVVLATPPPFDPRPIAAKLQPPGAPEYGYKLPFEGYDGMLGSYADWLVSKRLDGWKVVDVHDAVKRSVDSIRESDPGFTVARDGVHPDSWGHWLIARAFLEAWDAPGEVDSAALDLKTGKVSAGNIGTIARDGVIVTFTWATRIPMPRDPSWDPRLVDREKFDDRFNRHRLVLTGLDRPRYSLSERGQKLGEFTKEQLAEGVDLLKFPDLSTNRRASKVRALVDDRRSILDPAWLQAIGHGPPVMPKAPTLEEAKARADALEARIRDLARPIPVDFMVVPVGK